MTIPGGMMRESVERLRDSIAASKAASEEVKRTVAAQEVVPVTIGQEGQNERSGAQESAA